VSKFRLRIARVHRAVHQYNVRRLARTCSAKSNNQLHRYIVRRPATTQKQKDRKTKNC